MKGGAALEAADVNNADAFRLLVQHAEGSSAASREFGAIEAIATGAAYSFFNPILALRVASAPVDLRRAVGWMDSLGLASSIHIREDRDPGLVATARRLGFEINPRPVPVYVLDPLPFDVPPAPEGVDLRVGGRQLAADWYAGNGAGLALRSLFTPSFLDDPRVRAVVAYFDERPVSTALAIVGGGVVGIYAVGTLPEVRRRGIGTAATWAAIRAGAEAWSATTAILQSSSIGESVYEAMGFRQIGRYLQSERPVSGAERS